MRWAMSKKRGAIAGLPVVWVAKMTHPLGHRFMIYVVLDRTAIKHR